MNLSLYRIFFFSLGLTVAVIVSKYLFHDFHWEVITLGSLHSSVISGVIFVLGFILSSTLSDYKEAERIPADISSTIEDMSEDVESIHARYPKFNHRRYHTQLLKVAEAFAGDLRNSKSNQAKSQLYSLGRLHSEMEEAGVPANFIVKLKQQQASLVRHLFRVNYIQRINFIPSASILAWSIVVLAISLLLFTEVEPFFGGMVLAGVISFILIYVLQLIRVIRTPFHDEGITRDDVSLFLIDRTIEHLRSNKSV